MPLNYHIDGSTETIATHVSADSSWEDHMEVRESGSTKYIAIDSDPTNLDQSRMRVRKNSTTYRVLFNGSTTPTSGTILCMGDDYYGQFGQGSEGDHYVSSPVQFSGSTDWAKVEASLGSTIAIKTNGTLWACGRNQVGELGQGNRTHRSSPVQIGSLTSWTAISAASASLIARRSDSRLYAWGYNNGGQLGNGTNDSASSPVLVGGGAVWSNNFCVTETISVYAIRNNGTLWAWGSNQTGCLGIGAPSNNPYNSSSPIQIGALTDWDSVSGGSSCGMAIRSGRLYAWGTNGRGQLGQGDQTARSSPVQIGSDTNWSKVSIYYDHVLAIKTDGSLWAWGYNHIGQLGLGDLDSRSSPTQIGSDTWVAVSTGWYSSAAVKSDGTLWTWGDNDSGQMGINTKENQSSPVQVGHGSDWSNISSSRNLFLSVF